ncbi:MAG TPA: DUF4239 domain-containing protein [Candidatus Eisenbacteria bacterium]|nr:DUF4239 domain-containing protein [Candidatus Eisenbacteria bacterium]
MSFLFDLPLLLSGPLVIGGLVLVGNLGLHWFRKHRLPRLKFGEGDGDFLAAVLASIMVFYGLATALIAVHVFEIHQRVKEITKHEATSLAVLYRNVSEYPEPASTELRLHLRAYTYQVIHSAWPLLRRGKIPVEGVMYMNRFQSTLMRFEPTTEAQKVLALNAIAAYNEMIQVRNMRIDSVDRALPGVMWLVIVLGALISLVSAYYFPVHDSHVHHVQVSLLAGFIGLVIFLVLALDRPFHGDLGVEPHAYEIIYKQLMER